jgi:aminotransferase
LTDEIYEHLVYDGREHVAPATLSGMRDRTITINGLSKTFSVTGWRVGYIIAPPDITSAIRKVHDFLTVGAPAPLQAAGAIAMRFPDGYFEELRAAYAERRDLMVSILENAGFNPFVPDGAYYVICDISNFGFPDDVSFARFLVKEIGVAVVPGSSFFHSFGAGVRQVRFAFPKKIATLERVRPLLERIPLAMNAPS